jgi:2-polyprenyl-6-methoxyphenol hydroxylase-like FAD-dependent oxidoreductase
MPAEQMGDLLKERLAGYGGLIGELRDSITSSEGIVYSPLSEVMLPSPWYRGRVIVLGDGAHACAPHLTQGAGMALEDAVVLAEELDAPNRGVGASLQAFMERRYERVKLVQDVSHQILFGEMAVTAAALPQTVDYLRQTLPGQMTQVETFLNGAF